MEEMTVEQVAKMRAEEAASVYSGEPAPPREDPLPDTENEEGITDDVEAHAEEKPSVTLEDLSQTLSSLSGKLGAIDEISNRVKQVERRVGAVTNKVFNAEQTRVNDTIEKEKAALNDELKSFKEEFPALDAAIVARLELAKKSAKSSEDVDAVQSSIAEIKETLQKKVVTHEELARVREEAVLTATHPDWRSVVSKPEYAVWLSSQDAEMKRRAEEGETADDGITVLNAFKKHLKAKSNSTQNSRDRNERRLKKAVNTPGRSAPPTKAVQDMTDAEYRAYAKREIFG